MGTEEVVDGVTRSDDTSDAAARGGDVDGKFLPKTLVTLSIPGLSSDVYLCYKPGISMPNLI